MVVWGLTTGPLGSLALAPPQHCIQLTFYTYLLHESKLFSPAEPSFLPWEICGPWAGLYILYLQINHI